MEWLGAGPQRTSGHQALIELGTRIWAWRAQHQPRSRDDIPRLERPPGWAPDVSRETILRVRDERDVFADELAALDPGPDIADIVDHRLLGSLLARVRYEIEVVRAWERCPRFYIDQALGPIFDVLLEPGLDEGRLQEVIRLLGAASKALAEGRWNLMGTAVGEFADLAIAELADVETRLAEFKSALAELFPDKAMLIAMYCIGAEVALTEFRDYLLDGRPLMQPWTPIGAGQYQWFLREVALLPFTGEELLAIGSLELDRAMTLEQIERNRAGAPDLTALPADAAAQSAHEAMCEQEVRDFYVKHGLLTQPDDLGHYLNAPMPAYLEPLRFLGVSDDLTSPSRLDENGVSYVPEPTPDLPYFYKANAVDPRAGIVHEGAHYQQLALSWRHPRPLRRHFYDSGANEGIAFYNEEMLLNAGLFDDAPQTRAIMYNFMRLRALRVKVDVGLATGTLTIEQAADYLATEVPMDVETATEEAASFAEGPGQAISYQIGKTQIIGLIADAVRLQGKDVSLQQIHDHLWLNGNVPIALSRWELLGLTDQLERIGVTSG